MHGRSRPLIRGSEGIAIGARAFDLLDLLIACRNRVVGRDEIMASVWPDTVVGGNNLNVEVGNLRCLLGPEATVTVPGRGLRFALEVDTEGPLALGLPDRPSVVVLPFSDLGGDPELSWFADGFVEDITAELSRFRDLFVVARNSAFVFRQTPRDLRAVSRGLGVRYAVEGSVRDGPARARDGAADRRAGGRSCLGGGVRPRPCRPFRQPGPGGAAHRDLPRAADRPRRGGADPHGRARGSHGARSRAAGLVGGLCRRHGLRSSPAQACGRPCPAGARPRSRVVPCLAGARMGRVVGRLSRHHPVGARHAGGGDRRGHAGHRGRSWR